MDTDRRFLDLQSFIELEQGHTRNVCGRLVTVGLAGLVWQLREAGQKLK